MDTTTGQSRVVLEVCVDNFTSAIAAEAGGAGRLELCTSLAEGGLTPSVGFLKKVKSQIQIPIFVMIRPRGGDFVYSEEELEIMKEDVQILKKNGADGFVFGILTTVGGIDVINCTKLLSHCLPLPVTFHRAFDLTYDPIEALQQIISIGFNRILTSGQKKTAEEGIELIKSLIENASGRIVIMAGAGVTLHNVSLIVNRSNITEVHGSFRKEIESKMISFKNSEVSMGSTPDEMKIYVTNEDVVRAIVHQLSLPEN